jgi:hypothetical protein
MHATRNTYDVIAYNVTRGIRIRVCESRPGPAWPSLPFATNLRSYRRPTAAHRFEQRLCVNAHTQQGNVQAPKSARAYIKSTGTQTRSSAARILHTLTRRKRRASVRHSGSTCRPLGWRSACGRLATHRAAGARTAGRWSTDPTARRSSQQQQQQSTTHEARALPVWHGRRKCSRRGG